MHNSDSPLLLGEVKDGDVVKEVNEPSFIDAQQKLIWFVVSFLFLINFWIYQKFFILTFVVMKSIYNFNITFHLTENNIDFIIYFSIYWKLYMAVMIN